VVGLELEYAVVDAALRPRCLVEQAFRAIHGRHASEIQVGSVGFSNELAAHLFEVKTLAPQRSLARAETQLFAGLKRFDRMLRERFDARLLPTGMHPFMRPEETRLWPRAGRRIYRAYARIFDIRQHGWLNVQATHVNLPFGTEHETVALHNAVACVLPYLPALAASSPVVEGRLGPFVDNRLAFYRVNQRRLPLIAGRVIPEFVTSFRDYRRRILRPIYRALDGVPDGGVLRHEWVNSRGAILRFMRNAIEIRILDAQECVRAEVAIAVLLRGTLRRLLPALGDGRLALPPHGLLVQDFDAVVRNGGAARVAAPHLLPRHRSTRATARHVLERLLEWAEDAVPSRERPYLRVVEDRISRGSLSERIRRAVRHRAPRPGGRRRDAIAAIYRELSECLRENVVWPG
jgi:gamma-glutamyl:cysteine ligase YbdK (ATP-grasp superfamily)